MAGTPSSRTVIPVHSACRYAVTQDENGMYGVFAVHSLLAIGADILIVGSEVGHDGMYSQPFLIHGNHTYTFAPTHEKAFKLRREAERQDSETT